jgi:hypothetical protein
MVIWGEGVKEDSPDEMGLGRLFRILDDPSLEIFSSAGSSFYY